MSNVIDQAFINMYTNNVTMLFQQQGSKLRPHVFEKSGQGEFEFFERVGPTEATDVLVRHAETTYTNTDHTRRRVGKTDSQWADLIDVNDLHRILIDPVGPYTVNAGWAMGRKVDDRIIAAFFAAADTGKDGSTSVAFPAAQIILNGGTNMTLDKLREAKQKFDDNDVDESVRNLVWSPAAVNKLLADTTLTSADFNTVKALVDGEIRTFVGFNYIMSTRLPVAANIRKNFAWVPTSMGLAMGMGITSTVDRLPTRNNSTQVLVMMSSGAVRIVDEGVVEIDIDETA